MDRIYRRIPLKEEEKSILQDLYTLKTYYTLFQSTYIKSEKAGKEANTNCLAYMGTPEYMKMREEIKNCYNHDACNFVMIDRYQEDIEIYRLFARTILNSACSVDLSSIEGGIGETGNVGNVYVTCLEKFDVFIILRYMKPEELKTILRDACKEYLDIDNCARSYLQQIVSNLAHIKKREVQYFRTFLTFIGYIKLDEKIVEGTLEEINSLQNDYTLRVWYNEIMRFLWCIDKQKIISDKCACGLKRLIKILAAEIYENAKDLFYYNELLVQSISTYSNLFGTYLSEKLELLSKTDQYDILIRIYRFCESGIQNNIKRTISS